MQFAALCCAIAAGSGVTATSAAAAAIAPVKAAKELHEAAPRAHVYLMRGLMNIFSLGMDQLAAAIAGRGSIEASVNNHAEADAIVGRIAARCPGWRPRTRFSLDIRFGADAVMLMAQSLRPDGYTGCSGRSVRWHRLISAPKNVACVLRI